MEVIYVDHAATSPVHPDVINEMLPFFNEHYGNPSSIHQIGRRARQAVDEARNVIAKLLQTTPQSLVFTSGGTEADNLALFGAAFSQQEKGKHIITTKIEHHAVLHTCQQLEELGFEVTYLPVDETGKISVQGLQNELRDDTILVSIMYGNNEVGTVQPINQVGELLREHQALFHCDAVQACGVIPLNMNELPVDLLSISAHKINGPKGIGLLYIKEGIHLQPSLYGGEQERKRRAGTENVAGIVGFSKAMQLTNEAVQQKTEKYQQLSYLFYQRLEEEQVEFFVNGHQSDRLPHIFNVSFPNINIESLLMNLDLAGIAASSGSACTAGSVEPSHVLLAMHGDKKERVESAIRFSFGLNNTIKQINFAASETAKIVKRLQQQSMFID
ncbi:cysteine desulfurase family protein [Halalkalibacter urbisdiaboli]|uniref:cysteine desulfurase family protein n=1 Tax=Halalkalibacter urbisdiaboli TaxID=1960589 RepID=UPI000B42FA0D|nr:cysteine desulfurase family protein [Halalkalibacter urbisdiaboli]